MKGVLCNQTVVKNILDGSQTQDRRPMRVQPERIIIDHDADIDGECPVTWFVFDDLTAGKIHYDFQGIKRPGKSKLTSEGAWCNRRRIRKGGYETGGRWSRRELNGLAPSKVGDILYVREAWKVDHVYRKNSTYNYHRIAIQYYGVPRGPCKTFRTEDDSRRLQAIHYYDKSRNWRPNIHMPKWAARIFLEVTEVRCERVQDISEWDAIREGVRGIPVEVDGISVSSCKLDFKRLWQSLYPGSWERNDWVWVRTFKKIKKPQ